MKNVDIINSHIRHAMCFCAGDGGLVWLVIRRENIKALFRVYIVEPSCRQMKINISVCKIGCMHDWPSSTKEGSD